MVSLPVQSMGNSLYFGDPLITPNDYAFGIAFGALSGGLTNGKMCIRDRCTAFLLSCQRE